MHNLFNSLDLNLLKVFESLYQTGSVSITADELNLSQSACSHALQRLRERLDDELFVRVGNKMLPTKAAKEFSKHVLPSLTLLKNGLRQINSFSPNTRQVYKIASTDFSSWCMREFVGYLNSNYPNIKIEFIVADENYPEQELESEVLDFFFGFEHQKSTPDSLMYQHWFEDNYICVSCKSNNIGAKLTLSDYLTYNHIMVVPWNESRGLVDIALAKIRKKRRVVTKTTSLLAAPHFICNSKNLAILPLRFVKEIAEGLSLKLTAIPFDVPNYNLGIYWHKTRMNDTKINWFLSEFKSYYKVE